MLNQNSSLISEEESKDERKIIVDRLNDSDSDDKFLLD